jgi:predicted enzyme related to lactoylglutathione lyase
MTPAGARLLYANLFAKDIDALSRFYAELLGLKEIDALRSPIYRCLDANGAELGFNAYVAYELLNVADRKPRGRAPVSAYFTFELPDKAAVEAAAERTVSLGGQVAKAPYVTYYNAYQAVLSDPEGNVFRVNHRL